MSQDYQFPIAITGNGIRFPGKISNTHQFWQLISKGDDAIIDIPKDRWDVDRFYDADPEKPGKMYVKKGGFLQNPVDDFDALYFGITPREAACMDPQQRLILTVVWEALHDAGIVPESLAGSNAGVYVGAFTLDNLIQQMGPLARELIGPHTAVGSTMTILSNRISYLLDIRGPSLSIDTACSSSLVATHHACQAIWTGQCDMALVGGVNVMFRPEYLIAMCKGKFLAKDGYCKSFDARADGYARGEGAGALVLKPLAAAERDGDKIHGVINATGVNQDGRSNGITSPNQLSQSALIQEVHNRAGVKPEDISYVEAHGTGTQAGDSAESHSLGESLGKNRPNENPLPVGSVKANLGHLEAASGIAGLVKAMLCLKHKKIPPIANLDKANPSIPFAKLGIHLPRKLEPMQQRGKFAYAAVNSFGYGGTNAHILLSEPPTPKVIETTEEKHHLLTISAKDPQALSSLVQSNIHSLTNNSELNLTNFCYSSAIHRGHYQYRVALYGKNREQIIQQCQEFISYEQGELLRTGQTVGTPEDPVFVFTGMGPQWWAMGRELFKNNKIFKETALKCDEAFKQVSGWSILEEMLKDEDNSKISLTTIAQPANFLIQASLTAIWYSLGIKPAAIVGHSVGEVTAAYVAGVLTLEETVRVSYYRSQIQSKAAGQGGMLAVGLSHQKALEILATYPDEKVDIAAINGPESLTLSGDTVVLKRIAEKLESEGLFQRSLQVEVAYHSPYMDPLMPEMREALSALKPKAPKIPLYSTVTGEQVENDQAYNAEYWCKNARQAVLFAPAVNTILEAKHRLFLEVGPHPVLSTSLKQCAAAKQKQINCIASLHRKKDEIEHLLLAIADLYIEGCDIHWKNFYPKNSQYINLPAYPWQPNSHWLESEKSRLDRLTPMEHPLLGISNNTPEPQWSSQLNQQLQPYLPDHRVEDLIILPGAAYVEIGLAIHQQTYGQTHWAIENLNFFSALVIDPKNDPQIQTHYNQNNQTFNIYSRGGNSGHWQSHANGRLSTLPPKTQSNIDLNALLGQMHHRVSKDVHYENMTSRGLQYGINFQGIDHIWQGKNALLAQINTPETIENSSNNYFLHPAVLDACFQSLLSVLPEDDKRAFVPTTIRRIAYFGQPSKVVYCYGSVESMNEKNLIGNLTICDPMGNILIELSGIKAQSLSQPEYLSNQEFDQWLYQYEWLSVEPPTRTKNEGNWLIIGDSINANPILSELNSSRITMTHIRYGDELLISDEGGLSINPHSASHIIDVFKSQGANEYEGIIYFPPVCHDINNGRHDLTSNDQTNAALAFIQGLARSEAIKVKTLYFVTECAQTLELQHSQMQLQQSGIIALLRVAANEYAEYQFHSIDIDGVTATEQLIQEIFSESNENEIALRQNQRWAMRMQRHSQQAIQEYRDQLSTATKYFDVKTDDNKICLTESRPVSLTSEEELCDVLSSTLLASDIMTSTTCKPKTDYPLSTRLILVKTPHGENITLSNTQLTNRLAVKKDDYLGLNRKNISAAQLSPILYQTIALRVLHDIAQLQHGQTILIHAADTPIGTALVNQALTIGAHVYLSLTEVEKNTDHFCHNNIKGVYSSDTLCFKEALYTCLGKNSMNVIINPIAGEIATGNLTLIKDNGLLIDFSETELVIPRNVRTYRLSIDTLIKANPTLLSKQLDIAYDNIKRPQPIYLGSNSLSVIDLKSKSWSEYCGNFHHVFFDDAVYNQLFVATKKPIDPNATYLITGGFGGFGQGIVKKLIAGGAKYLVIASRSGGNKPEDHALLDECTKAGVTVLTPNLDISNNTAVKTLLTEIIEDLPPLKGIIHTAGVLDDSPINFISDKKLQSVMEPKVNGAWNLHEYSLQYSLDFFLLFSSVASMIGAAGQGAYVVANVWLDQFSHYRHSQGLPSTTISWGALGEVGMAAIDDDVTAYFERVGLKPMSPAKTIDALEQALDWNLPHVGIVDMNWQAWGSYYPAWAKSPRYQHLAPSIEQEDGNHSSSNWLNSWQKKSEDEQLDEILEKLIAIIANAMKLPKEKISGGNNLPELGIDSLIAMELQTLIKNDLDIRVSTLELMKGNALSQTAENIRNYHLEKHEDENTILDKHEDTDSSISVDNLNDSQIEKLLEEMA